MGMRLDFKILKDTNSEFKQFVERQAAAHARAEAERARVQEEKSRRQDKHLIENATFKELFLLCDHCNFNKRSILSKDETKSYINSINYLNDIFLQKTEFFDSKNNIHNEEKELYTYRNKIHALLNELTVESKKINEFISPKRNTQPKTDNLKQSNKITSAINFFRLPTGTPKGFPKVLFKLIYDNLEFANQVQIRQTSHELKEMVDNSSVNERYFLFKNHVILLKNISQHIQIRTSHPFHLTVGKLYEIKQILATIWKVNHPNGLENQLYDILISRSTLSEEKKSPQNEPSDNLVRPSFFPSQVRNPIDTNVSLETESTMPLLENSDRNEENDEASRSCCKRLCTIL